MRKAQDVATADTGQAASPRNEQKAQRPDAAEGVGVGTFARARLGHRSGVELEGAREVMGHDAELLPSAVSAVVIRRHDVEGELALEFSECFFLRSATTDKGVQSGQVHGQV